MSAFPSTQMTLRPGFSSNSCTLDFFLASVSTRVVAWVDSTAMTPPFCSNSSPEWSLSTLSAILLSLQHLASSSTSRTYLPKGTSSRAKAPLSSTSASLLPPPFSDLSSTLTPLLHGLAKHLSAPETEKLATLNLTPPTGADLTSTLEESEVNTVSLAPFSFWISAE